jgi:hypothetical protein
MQRSSLDSPLRCQRKRADFSLFCGSFAPALTVKNSKGKHQPTPWSQAVSKNLTSTWLRFLALLTSDPRRNAHSAVTPKMEGLSKSAITSIVYADNSPDPAVMTLNDFRIAAAKRQVGFYP